MPTKPRQALTDLVAACDRLSASAEGSDDPNYRELGRDLQTATDAWRRAMHDDSGTVVRLILTVDNDLGERLWTSTWRGPLPLVRHGQYVYPTETVARMHSWIDDEVARAGDVLATRRGDDAGVDDDDDDGV